MARGDGVGKVVGMLTFLGGIALLLVTFSLAYRMFSVPPDQALGLKRGETLDVGMAGQSLASILVRVLLLVVMALAGSLVASRGISLYSHSTRPAPAKPENTDA